MPTFPRPPSQADASALAQALYQRQSAGQDDIDLIPWLATDFDINLRDARILFENYESGFDFSLDPAFDPCEDDPCPSPPTLPNLIHHAAFELARQFRQAEHKRRSSWERRSTIAAIIFVILCGFPAIMPLHLPHVAAFALAMFGGAIAGALTFPRSLPAGITSGVVTGVSYYLSLTFYIHFRHNPTPVESALLAAPASIPGIFIGVLIYKAHRRHRWRTLTHRSTLCDYSASAVEFPDLHKPKVVRIRIRIILHFPAGIWFLLKSRVRRRSNSHRLSPEPQVLLLKSHPPRPPFDAPPPPL